MFFYHHKARGQPCPGLQRSVDQKALVEVFSDQKSHWQTSYFDSAILNACPSTRDISLGISSPIIVRSPRIPSPMSCKRSFKATRTVGGAPLGRSYINPFEQIEDTNTYLGPKDAAQLVLLKLTLIRRRMQIRYEFGSPLILNLEHVQVKSILVV